MNEQNKVYSSKSERSTRVKMNSWKKTVGITLPEDLIERARHQRLNISKVTEQALSSILDYLQVQTVKSVLDQPSFKKVVADPEGFEPPFSGSEGRRLDPDWATGPNHNYARFRLKRFCEMLEPNIYTID